MIYLDTSLVVSLYCRDANSAAATSALQSAKAPLLITTLEELEAVNAFALRLFRKEITSLQARSAKRSLETDLASGVYLLRGVPEPAFARARQLAWQLTAKLGTRTADLLHVAAALELGAFGFFSFDLRQRTMARAAGLKLNRWP
ncbi:MAG: type II toxin-antitoxin system VapC family toxin [Terracidiphilus sp.]